ncbi:hypothetical protein [Methylobacterium sp. JK268]
MTTPPKQNPLLALTYPVAFLAGALALGTLANGWVRPAPVVAQSFEP